MAGGVTSGIIYPGAVARISENYSFHSIGGTSVGAIAAAGTAAAEYQRRETGSEDGFRHVESVPLALASKAPDGRSRLYHLFTPDYPTDQNRAIEDTRPMMALLSPLIGQGGWLMKFAKILWGGIRNPAVFLSSAAVTLAGLAMVWTLAAEGHGLMALTAAIATLALAIGVASVVLAILLLWRWLPAMARNGFGICTGLSSPNSAAGFLGLTPWMHETIQKAAGRTVADKPLTFGDLWGAGKCLPAADPKAARAIELSMITSDVSRQRSAQFPFIEVPTPLYFDPEKLRRYFPENIINWMIDHSGPAADGVDAPQGIHRLPAAADLPVVLAARMSLSFPVLLSAVPLMGVKYQTGNNELEEVWYSDGGLTSNFPVHLFDGPIPSHPTFCLNLVAYDTALHRGPRTRSNIRERDSGPSEGFEKAAGESAAPGKAMAGRVDDETLGVASGKMRSARSRGNSPKTDAQVWEYVGMTKRNEEYTTLMTPFEGSRNGLFSFAAALINTARFWSDNQLLGAPGVRDRVVHIALLEGEGGLNLDMPEPMVADLDRRGQAAGTLIAARFNPGAAIGPKTGDPISHSFPNHRWVRFRNTMAAFEDLSRRFAAAVQKSEKAAADRNEISTKEMIRRSDDKLIGYPARAQARRHFQNSRNRLLKLAQWIIDEERANPLASYDPYGPDSDAPRRTMRYLLRPLADNDPRAERGDPPAA
jgi:predicted acylesterase/phospholipase RssA